VPDSFRKPLDNNGATSTRSLDDTTKASRQADSPTAQKAQLGADTQLACALRPERHIGGDARTSTMDHSHTK
jgi:hypothetical protein